MSPIPRVNLTTSAGVNPVYIAPRSDGYRIHAWTGCDINGFDGAVYTNIGSAGDCATNCNWYGNTRLFTYNGNERRCICKKPTYVGDFAALMLYGVNQPLKGYDFPGKFDRFNQIAAYDVCRSVSTGHVTVYNTNTGVCYYKEFPFLTGRDDVICGYTADIPW